MNIEQNVQHDEHVIESIRYAMNKGWKDGAWWLNKTVDSLLRYAADMNWVSRNSTTQVHWIEYKMGKFKY
jgi:hypothetical protein